jgi:hypothetical protein
MTGQLSPDALDRIEEAGLTLAQYAARAHWGRPGWWGDRCGCYDDRCVGHHHDIHEECPCLSVLIEEALAP